MAFAFNYFNVAQTSDIEGASTTYENVNSQEDIWNIDATVLILGQKFKLPEEKDSFKKAMRAKLWFTYRKGFEPIGGIGPTSDSGWGCMLRCGQMMLSQALFNLTIHSDWKWHPISDENCVQPLSYRKILTSFNDQRSSCYSIHQIAQMGVEEGKQVGQWFGPNTIAQVLRRLSKFDDNNALTIHVAMDNTVCLDDIENLCGTENKQLNGNAASSSSADPVSYGDGNTPSEKFWKPLFLIIPLRLGLSEINPIYFEHLKECLEMDVSVGVIGGKPNHAYYFLGTCQDSLVFLDPHTTQPFIPFNESDCMFDDSSYHCETPNKMPLTQLDPSLAIGFVCTTRLQFDNLHHKIKSFKKTPTSYPLFEIVKNLPQCNVYESSILSVKSHSRQKHRKLRNGEADTFDDSAACLALDSDESFESDDEFEILDVRF